MKIKSGLEAEYAACVAKNSQDPYSHGVMTYLERWAALLEQRIPSEATSAEVLRIIVDHGKDDSHEADSEGITGFMYGCAVTVLAQFWVYGEELRRWHNMDVQIGTEGDRANESGGVLNPALLNVTV